MATVRLCSHLKWFVGGKSCSAVRTLSSFQAASIDVRPTKSPFTKPKVQEEADLPFGHVFSDHMFKAEWSEGLGWGIPRIEAYGNLVLSPAAPCLHYATEVFEGLKAYRCDDGKIRMFRPIENMQRMLRSCRRSKLPEFDSEQLLACLKRLVQLDREWVPHTPGCSLYIRPAMIGTSKNLGVSAPNECLLFIITSPVGPYFKNKNPSDTSPGMVPVNPVKLLAETKYVRAWPGGVGDSKVGSNYGPTIHPQKEAEAKGCAQLLWLFGPEQRITEVGTMNMFMHWTNHAGEEELITPPLNGLILPGVTRKSLIELAKEWNVCKVTEGEFTMADLLRGLEEGRVKEVFGAGTACVICPVNSILYQGKDLTIPTDNGVGLSTRLRKTLMDIQYGKIPHKWAVDIDS